MDPLLEWAIIYLYYRYNILDLLVLQLVTGTKFYYIAAVLALLL